MPKQNSYLDHLDNVVFRKKENSEDQIINFLDLINKLPQVALVPDQSFFAIDYSKKNYILVKGNLEKTMGHKSMDFFYGGLEFIVEVAQKDDFKIYNENIFKGVLNVLNTTPQHEHGKYTFSHNFRLKDNSGRFKSIIQTGRYITCPLTRTPLFSYGATMDISAFKKDTSVVQVIDKYESGENGLIHNNIVTNYYFPNPDEGKLTKREKEILFWIGDGLSIKALAAKLYVTESTITNHRKNIMRKTNTKNVAQLIAYAVRNGII